MVVEVEAEEGAEVEVVAQAVDVLFGVDEKNVAMALVLGCDEGSLTVDFVEMVGDRDSHVVVDDTVAVVAFLHAVWLPIYSTAATIGLGEL